MPLLGEGSSKRNWRRQVVGLICERVDVDGQVRWVTAQPDARREMYKVAKMLPPDLIAEIYEDDQSPQRTYLVVRRFEQLPAPDPSVKVQYPEGWQDRAVGQ